MYTFLKVQCNATLSPICVFHKTLSNDDVSESKRSEERPTAALEADGRKDGRKFGSCRKEKSLRLSFLSGHVICPL
jgi:hypothetical protein